MKRAANLGNRQFPVCQPLDDPTTRRVTESAVDHSEGIGHVVILNHSVQYCQVPVNGVPDRLHMQHPVEPPPTAMSQVPVKGAKLRARAV